MKAQAMYNSDIQAAKRLKRQERIYKILSLPLVIAVCSVDSWVEFIL